MRGQGPGLRRRARWSAGRAAELARRAANPFARVNREPILVLGNQKSGTTAIAALLGRHTGLSVTLDVPALWGATEEAIRSGRVSLEEVVDANRVRFGRDIVKEPSLSFLGDGVRRAFPGARIVVVVRDPRDNIRSVLDRLGLPGDRTDLDAGEVGGLEEHWRSWLRPEALGLAHGSYVEAAAHRWNVAADCHLEHAAETLLVRYEDFLADKAGAIAALAERLGLRRAGDVAAEAERAFQPPGRRDVRWDEFFGERNLALVNDLCGERMARLRYDRDRVTPEPSRRIHR